MFMGRGLEERGAGLHVAICFEKLTLCSLYCSVYLHHYQLLLWVGLYHFLL